MERDIYCEDVPTLCEIIAELVRQGLTFEACAHPRGWRIRLTGGF